MGRAFRFAALLVLGLAGLTAAASVLVQHQTRAWFEKDLNLRARLAVNGAHDSLATAWRRDRAGLRERLTDLAQDERILGACAAAPDGTPLARTADFPDGLTGLVQRAVREGPDARWGHWAATERLPGGDVHVSVLPMVEGTEELGFVVLVHDLAFVARRDARTRLFLLCAFGVLALSASVLTLVASRMSWRSWSEALRSSLRGVGPRREFQPILSDVRALVDRLMDQEGRSWTPERLRETLRHHLSGEKVVVLANREPYVHQRRPDGRTEVMHPASGLVTALEPILRACSGTWIAHASGSADRETADRDGRLRVPPGEGSYSLRRVWLGEEEERGYYYGFANEGLWPLCHIAHTRPAFRSSDWQQYRAVNEKFVRAVLDEVDAEDPIVLVQDYHFALAPTLIRRACRARP
jgi:trehalose 6-phosphate synthase